MFQVMDGQLNDHKTFSMQNKMILCFYIVSNYRLFQEFQHSTDVFSIQEQRKFIQMYLRFRIWMFQMSLMKFSQNAKCKGEYSQFIIRSGSFHKNLDKLYNILLLHYIKQSWLKLFRLEKSLIHSTMLSRSQNRW